MTGRVRMLAHTCLAKSARGTARLVCVCAGHAIDARARERCRRGPGSTASASSSRSSSAAAATAPERDRALEVLAAVRDAVRAEAHNGERTLFLFGTYTIGKERVFFEAAKALGPETKSYVGKPKRRGGGDPRVPSAANASASPCTSWLHSPPLPDA